MTEKELAKIAYEYADKGDDIEMFPCTQCRSRSDTGCSCVRENSKGV